MIDEREIDYAISFIKIDINYFLKYKNQLKKYSIDNRTSISSINMNNIIVEIENVTIYIYELKTQEQQLLNYLNKTYYGNQDN